MLKPKITSFITCLLIGLSALLASPSYAGEDDDEEDDEDETEVVAATPAATQKPAQAGALQNNIRRSREQTTLFERSNERYADYNQFKDQLEENYGLSYSFNLSYRSRWQRPADIGRSDQILFWPSLNWDMFDSERFGTGSIQLLYFGERSHSGPIRINIGNQTRSIDKPPYSNKIGQLTYTHALPGEKLTISIGQYSLFNFDSNPYLADQQQNFASSAFSENSSATYPATGLGAYLQYNLTAKLQLLGGFQNPPRQDAGGLSNEGFNEHKYTWWSHLQWMPKFAKLGEGQYSLTHYRSTAVESTPQSSGWSLNASQNLNKRWAVFGRANTSQEDGGSKKSSLIGGVALINPLQRSSTDQSAVSIGSNQQNSPLARRLGTDHSQQIEAYWNWTVLAGILLTPDLLYIRHPSYPPTRDSAVVFSLRTTLLF
ncbi:MAG: carbohydrate porin [Dechloromonas sp.]|uniref:Carbohydrate porin n=1 Tax=Candidatus Dechloromonas phosphorivorans TaxID=2899244 RepID=A0A935K792_9RHOO|nr:carbohydrate porin [Candidatus Dechloromonas phosphorivorans]